MMDSRQASFPTGTVGPRVGIFLSPLNTNDGFYISPIPVPAYGKDQKGTGACRPHIDHYFIVMLKLRHHAAFHHIQDFLEVFFMFFQYKMSYLVVSKKKNPIISVRVG